MKIPQPWHFLKSIYPDQINVVTITDKYGQRSDHLHIRTKLFNHLTIRSNIMQDLNQYQAAQNNASIDTLTNTLKALDKELETLSGNLAEKTDMRDIVRTTLSGKLVIQLDELGLDEADLDALTDMTDKDTDLPEHIIELDSDQVVPAL